MFKSQETLIAEIHNEFDTAQERLLQQANALLTDTVDSREKDVAERLKKAGFSNVPIVKKVSEKQKQLVTSKEQAELIQHYKFTYPFLKFLTEEELDRICQKYTLVHAPVDRYTKEVPEKNLRDIEQAQAVKEGDEWNWEKVKRERDELKRKQEAEQNRLMKGDRDFGRFYPIRMRYAMFDDFSSSSREKAGLFIAAPESHFNLKGMTKTSKFGFRTEVKDPIVFRYVRGGIQVLTKWGLEAEDPSLVVEKLN